MLHMASIVFMLLPSRSYFFLFSGVSTRSFLFLDYFLSCKAVSLTMIRNNWLTIVALRSAGTMEALSGGFFLCIQVANHCSFVLLR